MQDGQIGFAGTPVQAAARSSTVRDNARSILGPKPGHTIFGLLMIFLPLISGQLFEPIAKVLAPALRQGLSVDSPPQ
jgi:hypothetical protein